MLCEVNPQKDPPLNGGHVWFTIAPLNLNLINTCERWLCFILSWKIMLISSICKKGASILFKFEGTFINDLCTYFNRGSLEIFFFILIVNSTRNNFNKIKIMRWFFFQEQQSFSERIFLSNFVRFPFFQYFHFIELKINKNKIKDHEIFFIRSKIWI